MENEEEKKLDISVYYKSMTKKDKGSLVSYLIKRYDMSYPTIISKLNGRSKMTVLEQDMITNVIDKKLWES